MTLVIGLTGSIASGKSTVSQMFDEFTIPVIDADKIAKQVVEPGEKAYEQVVEAFGDKILQEDGSLDRKALGAIIFDNEEKRKTLNEIVHPAVREKMLSQRDHLVKEGERAVVLDIPLLYESKLTHFVEKVIVVYVDEEIQRKRLVERDESSVEDAQMRINAQIPVSEKAEMADAVIDNNGSKENSFEQLTTILRNWEII